MCRHGDAYILVAEVEDKLFGGVVLPPAPRRFWQGDVELQRGVGGHVGQVGRSSNLNTGRPVELHWHAHLDAVGGEKRNKNIGLP